MTTTYRILLTPQEERLAQLLTRDAWLYFSNLISQREIFHVKEIPMMPRRGEFELADDLEIAQYYVDEAENYADQLATTYGFDEETVVSATLGFIWKVETATGVWRGMGDTKIASA